MNNEKIKELELENERLKLEIEKLKIELEKVKVEMQGDWKEWTWVWALVALAGFLYAMFRNLYG